MIGGQSWFSSSSNVSPEVKAAWPYVLALRHSAAEIQPLDVLPCPSQPRNVIYRECGTNKQQQTQPQQSFLVLMQHPQYLQEYTIQSATSNGEPGSPTVVDSSATSPLIQALRTTLSQLTPNDDTTPSPIQMPSTIMEQDVHTGKIKIVKLKETEATLNHHKGLWNNEKRRDKCR
eukprot:CAMPEP_0194409370 /NCGR_PEP_ID=MMETSP0176-20130528/7250_1 /TAXON_ID=216777 /ORGANISM="Proboscia alata, Strain PI-D3" /LENGTH=174 /DNA_ID=CAMNT_0039209951 /DNA_START=1 /DNA_END=523 /DNA_ORIENTATION=+